MPHLGPIWLTVLLLAPLAGAARGDAGEPPPRLAQSSNALGFDLYERLRDREGNLAFSPASIEIALAMTWAGARGDTAKEMSRVLHLRGRRNGINV